MHWSFPCTLLFLLVFSCGAAEPMAVSQIVKDPKPLYGAAGSDLLAWDFYC